MRQLINQSIYLSIHESVNSSFYQSVNQSIINQSSHQFINRSIHHTIHPSINQFIHLSIHQSIILSSHQSTNPLINLSINQSINQPIYPLIIQFINRSINRSIHRSVHQLINQSIFLLNFIYFRYLGYNNIARISPGAFQGVGSLAYLWAWKDFNNFVFIFVTNLYFLVNMFDSLNAGIFRKIRFQNLLMAHSMV